MASLILLRHGQSVYNAENRFTGFRDVELTSRGRVEAVHAGTKLKNMGIKFDAVFTSTLRRAYETAEIAVGATSPLNDHLKNPDGTWNFTRHDDVRERDYGDLTGMNKEEIASRYGADQVHIWRRSYDVRPPNGENLDDVVNRVGPYFNMHIRPLLKQDNNVLLVAHGNTLRALYVFLGKETPETIVVCEFGCGEVIKIDVDE